MSRSPRRPSTSAEPLPNGDYYASITLPSLIVATYGGGTGLATQRECLELLGCYGAGKVRKLAEIVAATVLCGEISLGWAILAEEWVQAHDRFGQQPSAAAFANGRPMVRRRFTKSCAPSMASEGGFVAVEQAAALAGAEGRLTLLLVTSFSSEGDAQVPGDRLGAGQAHRRPRQGDRPRGRGAVHCRGGSGDPPSRVILDWSAQRDLLALGAPTTPRLRGMFIAGVADTALESFTTPLLVARSTPGEHQFGHRILVASDGREGSDELVELGQRLARARGADMILLHASGHESHERRERVEEQGRRLKAHGSR